MKLLKKSLQVIIIIGVATVVFSLLMEPFKDYELFQKEHVKLGSSLNSNKTRLFFELREKHLTVKYHLFDYGMTTVVLSIFLLFIVIKNKKLKTYNKKNSVFLLGLMSYLTLTGSMFIHLFIDFGRECFPYWADTIAIPMFYLGIFSIWILLYFLLNTIGLLLPFNTGVSLKDYTLSFKNFSYWYGFQFIGAFFILILCINRGMFISVFSVLLWLSFFYSMFVGRLKLKV
ncbi:hypothetical protein [uncultured Tenacibaculum sp.]|uniref:hypothetical protein n=1 Tax=uncultured Tenacibaculum sp. TaxID=174713 RepID=UPI0026198C6F|nr:hypothetical protein [uncultured Tenacibaculum sp.]